MSLPSDDYKRVVQSKQRLNMVSFRNAEDNHVDAYTLGDVYSQSNKAEVVSVYENTSAVYAQYVQLSAVGDVRFNIGIDQNTTLIPLSTTEKLAVPATHKVFFQGSGTIYVTELRGMEAAKIVETITTPTTPTVVAQVTSLTATAGDGEITLNWGAVSNASKYVIYSGITANSMSALSNGETSDTTYTHTGLTNGQERFYGVRAKASDGTLGTFSGVVYATPVEESVTPADTTAPTMVVTVSSDPVVDTTATVTFTASEPIVGFTLSDIYLDAYSGNQAGTLDNFQGSGAVYTARYTAPTDTHTDIEVGVGVNQFTDLAGNTYEGIAFVKFHVESTPIETEKIAFLLVGQSNMVGRADYDDGPTYPSTVQQWNQDGELVPAVSPLDHRDERSGDMGLALQFSIDYLQENPTDELALIPCADGGTSLNTSWGVGKNLSTIAINRTNEFFTANPSYKLGGILWHQGESDSKDEDTANAYQAGLDVLFGHFRSNITKADSTTPIIVGGLWIGENGTYAFKHIIQSALEGVVNRVAYTAFASSEGLGSYDNLHFDAAGLRTLGSRYYEALAVARENSSTVVPTIVPQVTGLTATVGDGEITLNWDDISNASKYVIYSGTNSDNMTALNNGETSNITYTHQGLSNGQERFYAVQAEASDGTTGDLSATVSATPVAPPIVVEQVTGLTATVGDGEVTLTWDAVSNASDYVILTGLNTSSMAALNDGVTPNTTYTHTGLTNGEERFYAVRAKASDDTLGDASNTVSATPIVPEGIPSGYIFRTDFETGSPVDLGRSAALSLKGNAKISDDPVRGKVYDNTQGDGGYLDTDKRNLTVGANSFTLSSWVKLTAFTGHHTIFGVNGDHENSISLRIIDGSLSILANSQYQDTGGVAIKEMPLEYLDTWIMVSVTYNRDSGDVHLYINGVEFSSGVDTPGGDFSDFRFIVYSHRGSVPPRMVGLADDGIIWDRELSPDEIADLYAQQIK